MSLLECEEAGRKNSSVGVAPQSTQISSAAAKVHQEDERTIK